MQRRKLGRYNEMGLWAYPENSVYIYMFDKQGKALDEREREIYIYIYTPLVIIYTYIYTYVYLYIYIHIHNFCDKSTRGCICGLLDHRKFPEHDIAIYAHSMQQSHWIPTKTS